MKLNDAMMNCTLVKKMSWVVLKCVNYYKSTHFWKYEKHISNQFAQGRDKDLRVGDAVAVRGEETTDLHPLVLPHWAPWYRVFCDGWESGRRNVACPGFPWIGLPVYKLRGWTALSSCVNDSQVPFSLENLLAATHLDQLLCFSIWSQGCPLCYFLCLRWCTDIPILLGCIAFFYLNIIYGFFFSFWDSINWIWFTHVYLNQCRCKEDQLVIKLV